MIEAESWQIFRESLRADWKPGEHASIIAATGGGKSTLSSRGLLPLWKHRLTIDVKGDDPELVRMPDKLVHAYPKASIQKFWFQGAPFGRARLDETRYRLVPPPQKSAATSVIHSALDSVFDAGHWLVYLDELRWLSDPRYLGVGADIERLWLFGRSKGITVLAGTQAPRWIPSAFYEQARHHFIFGTTKKATLKRLEEIDTDVPDVAEIVQSLEPFEFLYVGPRRAAISRYAL